MRKYYRFLMCAAASTAFFAVSALSAQDNIQQALQGKLYGKGNSFQVNADDVEAWRKDLVPSNIQPTERDMLRVLLQTRLFSEEARKQGLDNDPVIKKRVELEQMKFMADAYAKGYLEKNLGFDGEPMESYYLAHIDEFKKSATFHLYRLVTQDADNSKKAFDELMANPASIVEIVKKYSCDPATKPKDGEVGKLEASKLPSEIREKAKDAKAGTVFDPFEKNGFYYVYVVKGFEPETVQSFAEVKAQMKDKAETFKRQEIFRKHAEELASKDVFQWEPWVQDLIKNEVGPVR